jgi:hypothetical protein
MWFGKGKMNKKGIEVGHQVVEVIDELLLVSTKRGRRREEEEEALLIPWRQIPLENRLI